MVQSSSRDLYARHNLVDDLFSQGVLREIGMHPFKAIRHFDTQLICQYQANENVADINLVTQPDVSDLTVAGDSITDARHRIGEIDQQGVRADFFHIAHNFHQRVYITSSMGKTTRTAVFRVRLAQAIFKRNLEIRLP